MAQELSEQETEELVESTDSQEMDETVSTIEETDQTEVPNDIEEPFQSQVHQETESGPAISSQGSTYVTINYNYARESRDIIRVWERPYDGYDEEIDEASDVPKDVIERNVRFARQNMAQFDAPLPTKDGPFEECPLDTEQLSEKYYELEEYSRCYILAVALLHGATVREIYLRTDELYRLVLKEKYNTLKLLDKKQDTSTTATASPQLPMFPFPRNASLALQKKTWTVSYREKGAERIFWCGIDSTGYSSFEMRMLTFLAKESASKGEHWGRFFELIRGWAAQRGRKGKRNSQAESPWRSVRALGAILWYQDVVELQKLAEDWAKEETFTRRELAASLLNGAYEAECQKLPTGMQSAVWQLLDKWILQSRNPKYKTDIRLRCVAANTYGLISSSRIPPDIDTVLLKLDALLQIQQYNLAEYIGTLTATVSSTYVSLSLSGHIRQVLSSLAGIAEELVHCWEPPRALKLRNVYRWQRELRLDTVLNTFFLIATAMVPDGEIASQNWRQSYTQPLPVDIRFPDPNKRDILLVAILTEDKLAIPLRTLLCAAMFAKKSKPTFELISQWTDIILAVQDSQRANAAHVYTPFISFLVNLGKTIEQWSGDLQQRGYRQPVAYEAYQQKFIGWHTSRASKQPLDGLARDVLVGLT